MSGHNDARDLAIWRWANVGNLDVFLSQVYEYYTGKGVYNILLKQFINLATFAFVVGFTIYLTSCIDYSSIRVSHTLKEVEVPHCMTRLGGFSKFCLWVLTFVWFIRLANVLLGIPWLFHIRDFYLYLLGVNNSDIQTVSWDEIAHRIMLLRDDNPLTSNQANRKYLGHLSKQRMEERDISHRIMRRDNYFIGMINKDVLDFSIPFPFCRKYKWLTRSLKFNIDICVMEYVFNSQGQINSVILKYDKRKELAEGLRRRFMIAGAINLVFAPFLMVYLSLLYFFQYFDEYHKNPSSVGARQYSSAAEWKFREYNELYHSFRRRMDLSCYPATEYVNQFPKEMINQILRFVVIVAGAFAAVLAIASIIDPDVFLGFEISNDRNVLFYIGVFGTILAAARGMIQDERLVYDPEANLRYVAEFTHYLPQEWNGKLHTEEVMKEFTQYYSLKIVLAFQEMLSMIITPFVLWFSLPNSADKIIDYFRDCSLYEDGLGYVCVFAVYDFSKKPRLNSSVRLRG
ncbi:autophagy protein Apg9-domain-containing protein [Lipomyces oligophaga]|uniref:autophagy protein Apg9-domain-containing protein n=1 Tax=Lipomyces oligophaga TaxID=45792 RepID=UPI0034CDE24B